MRGSLQVFPSLYLDDGLNGTFLDGSKQRCVITLGLIRIYLGERGNRLCKCIAISQVAADHGRVTTAGMRTRKAQSTQSCVATELLLRQERNIFRQLHVAQLSHIDVDYLTMRPTQENVACMLH